ncbi:hypothetical protein PR048_012277 [Dryococelus australis]|uniref:Uncharacterized protein n=1 Tax=Dryococelus australis TaxID=614101 RepID=A0ABQ9HPN1_9NEOP|nr:hypothetical protein PR048_012277 [Dryococelus australis]
MWKKSTGISIKSAHGKGGPDGVGAALKITDSLVAHQVDIPDCDTEVPILQHCKSVTMKQVEEPVITSIDKHITKNVLVSNVAKKIHKVVFKKGSQRRSPKTRMHHL